MHVKLFVRSTSLWHCLRFSYFLPCTLLLLLVGSLCVEQERKKHTVIVQVPADISSKEFSYFLQCTSLLLLVGSLCVEEKRNTLLLFRFLHIFRPKSSSWYWMRTLCIPAHGCNSLLSLYMIPINHEVKVQW